MNANSLLAKTSTGSNLISYPRLTPLSFLPPPHSPTQPHSTSIFASSSRRFLNIENACPPLLSRLISRILSPLPTAFPFISSTLAEIREPIASSSSPTHPAVPSSPHRSPQRGSGNLTVQCFCSPLFFLCTVSHRHMIKHVHVYVVEREKRKCRCSVCVWVNVCASPKKRLHGSLPCCRH